MHLHTHQHPDKTEGHLKFGIFLNLAFAVLEVIIGILANSVAILSDAVHDFADSGVLLTSLIAARISYRPADYKRSFGYKRVSVLAALVNSSVLLVSTGFVLYYAIQRLFYPEPVVTFYMFVVAGLSVIINGIAVLRIGGDREANINLEGAFWHLLEDALGGLLILIGGLVIHFTGWYWVDSVLGVALAVVIVRGVISVLFRAVNIVLEGTPPELNLEKIEQAILQHPAVKGVHHIHIWALDTNHYNMSVHVSLQSSELPAGFYSQLNEVLHQFKVNHLTVQVEGPDAECVPCRDH